MHVFMQYYKYNNLNTIKKTHMHTRTHRANALGNYGGRIILIHFISLKAFKSFLNPSLNYLK